MIHRAGPPGGATVGLGMGLWALVGLKLALHLLALRHDDWFRDEFYYLACSYRLDWSYVDHPAASIAFLTMLGGLRESLFTLRLVAAVLGCATLVFVARLTRSLGGNRVAQALATATILFSPGFLALNSFYSMNAWEPLLWLAAGLIWVKLAERAQSYLWLLLAVVFAVGLHNKLSMMWFAFPSLALAFFLYRRRADMRVGVGGVTLAFFIALGPILWWQSKHGWPTIEFMANATRMKMLPTSPAEFWLSQLLVFGPLAALLAAIGALSAIFWRPLRDRGVVLGGSVLAIAALMSVTQGVRAYYLAPAYALAIPLGATFLSIIQLPKLWQYSLRAGVVLLLLVALLGLPLALPILSPEATLRYQAMLALSVPHEERFGASELPQHLADRHGWQDLAASVARAVELLPADIRSEVTVVAANYGEAGALEFYRDAYGLPQRIASPHNHYWFWAQPETWGEHFLTVGFAQDALTLFCAEVRELARVNCQWCREGERGALVAYCRYGGSDLKVDWGRLRRFL
ncbi:hypothetical protein HRbin30_01394 [bacterium HR30]|nr:hypothetical protein HRbin30_01394 [bacterium HR30]